MDSMTRWQKCKAQLHPIGKTLRYGVSGVSGGTGPPPRERTPHKCAGHDGNENSLARDSGTRMP
jgi:hypothetical protein